MHAHSVVAGFILVVSLAPFAQAQVTIDVAKINCDQFVHSKIAAPRQVAAWLSGYYHGKNNTLLLDLQNLDEDLNKLQHFCSEEKNFKVPVMDAIAKLIGPSR